MKIFWVLAKIAEEAEDAGPSDWGEACYFSEFLKLEPNHAAEPQLLCALCFLGDLCENQFL